MSSLLPPGTVLSNRYTIEKILGQGGMGAVYLVCDSRIPDKKWAVKELWDFGDPETRSLVQNQFKREASILAGLDHPNLPRITDFFVERHKEYLVMDFVEGEPLENIIQRKGEALDLNFVLEIIRQLIQVLKYLHTQNPPIIFRDLKPSNVMVSPEGRIKLIDFGIARIFSSGKPKDTVIMGTPGYAAPEQYGTGQSDPRTDIYGLGATVYFALTGQDPADNPFHFDEPGDLNPRIYPRLAKALLKCVQMESSDRFGSIQELEDYLFGKEAQTDNLTTSLSGTLPDRAVSSPDEISIEPRELSFGLLKKGKSKKLDFIIRGNVARAEIRSNEKWLKVYPKLVSGNDPRVGVTVYSSSLNHGGRYTAKLTVKGEGMEAVVPVSVEMETRHLNLLSYVLTFVFTIVSLVPILGIFGFVFNSVIYLSIPRGERKSIRIFFLVSFFTAVLWLILGSVLALGYYYLDWFRN